MIDSDEMPLFNRLSTACACHRIRPALADSMKLLLSKVKLNRQVQVECHSKRGSVDSIRMHRYESNGFKFVNTLVAHFNPPRPAVSCQQYNATPVFCQVPIVLTPSGVIRQLTDNATCIHPSPLKPHLHATPRHPPRAGRFGFGGINQVRHRDLAAAHCR